MTARVLVPLCWTLWGFLFVGLLYWLVRVATEGKGSPEAGPGLGLFLVLSMLALLAGAGVLLAWAARRQSTGWLITMTILLAYPLVPIIARPIILGHKARKYAEEEARTGDFRDPTLASMAQAVRANDVATLARLLHGQPPPAGKDRAGNDLLAYAVGLVHERGQGVEAVKALLDAGADPRASRTGDGVGPINALVFGSTPGTRDVVRLLLDHGADPDAVHPRTGNTAIRDVYNDPELLRVLVERGADVDRIQSDGLPAVVHFMSAQQWESALYLVEKGARLDLGNADGLSVDYYLNEWKDSVYGGHPEGWDMVRRAIEQRRGTGGGPAPR